MNIRASLWIFSTFILSSAGLFAQPQPTLFTVLHNFSGLPDGSGPVLPLVLGADNTLYGTTFSGGTNHEGIIFRINRDGSGYTVLHHFATAEQTAISPTTTPGAYIVLGRDGVLYGTTFGGDTYSSGVVFRLNTDGSDYTIIHSFTNNRPLTLIQGADGNLYGAGVDTAFKLNTNGDNYSVLHAFVAGTDGSQAYGKLLQASDGVLYGAARSGGTNGGFGTIFKLDTNGTIFEVLHTFGAGTDGMTPLAGLVEGSDGALYGTTDRGGTNSAGTIFKLNRNGSGYQVLHDFQTNGVDGQNAFGGVIVGLNNLLYGATRAGGTNNTGTIYKIGIDGSGYQILRGFSPAENGYNPYGGLVQGPASDGTGVLYGTAETGGPGGFGTVFALIVNPPISITPTVGQSGGHPVVTWPAWAINYQLQTTTNLAGTWVTTSNYVPVAGGQLTNDAPGAYYRLVWPQ